MRGKSARPPVSPGIRFYIKMISSPKIYTIVFLSGIFAYRVLFRYFFVPVPDNKNRIISYILSPNWGILDWTIIIVALALVFFDISAAILKKMPFSLLLLFCGLIGIVAAILFVLYLM